MGKCLFAVKGFGVRENSEISQMRMEDVAPTLASLMDIPLEGADGRDLTDIFLLKKETKTSKVG